MYAASVKEMPNFSPVIARPALDPVMLLVPGLHLFASPCEVRLLQGLLPHRLDPVVPDILPVVGRVRLPRPVVHVALPNNLRRKPKRARHPVHDLLDHEHALWPAEPAERRVGGDIGANHPAR